MIGSAGDGPSGLLFRFGGGDVCNGDDLLALPPNPVNNIKGW